MSDFTDDLSDDDDGATVDFAESRETHALHIPSS